MNDEFNEIPDDQYCLTDSEMIDLICEGCLAATDGLESKDNPYMHTSDRKRRLWLQGWLAGMRQLNTREQKIKELSKSVYVYAPQY